MKKNQHLVFQDLYTELGVMITVLCQEHGITIKQLQHLTGLHPRHICGIKKGLMII